MTINDLSLVVIILNRRRFPGSDRITNKQIFGDGGGGESTYIHCFAFECNHFTWENTPDMETTTHSSFVYEGLTKQTSRKKEATDQLHRSHVFFKVKCS